MADVFAQATSLHPGIALVAQCAASVLDEASIGQLHGALLAPEALGVPAGVHGLDHPADDELAALIAARSEQHMEVVLAVLTAVEFIEDTVPELTEALSAPGIFRLVYIKN